MGLRYWLQSAVATVSKSLTGRKRKAPEERHEEDAAEAVAPPPGPPSSQPNGVKQQQHIKARVRVSERLDFSSPLMNGPQRRAGQLPGGGAAQVCTQQQQQQQQQPAGTQQQFGTSYLGPTMAASRLIDSFTTAGGQAATTTVVAPEAAPGNQPFAKRFAQRRVLPQLHSSSNHPLLKGVRHVREAPLSTAKLDFMPATHLRQHQPSVPLPQLSLGQVQGLFTGAKRGGYNQRQQLGQRDWQLQEQQGHQRQHWQQHYGSSLPQPPHGAHRKPAAQLHDTQGATMLRRAVEINQRQEEQQQQRHHLQEPARLEVDLTREATSSQDTSQQQRQHSRLGVPAAGRPGSTGEVVANLARPSLRWQEMLRQVVLQADDETQLAVEEPAALGILPPTDQDRFAQWAAELSQEAQLATQRALQAHQRELEVVRQVHTALEQAQPQRIQQLEAEAQKIHEQLQQLQLHRQQASQQVQPPVQQQVWQERQQKQKPVAAADLEEVVELLSSSEDEEAAEVSFSVGPGASEPEESEVSQQLERIGLEEWSGPQPIPEEWRDEYEAALAPGHPGDVLVDHVRSSIQITRKDMGCMAPLQWLNDEVINLYISLLLERDAARRKQVQGPRCHFFSTFFANKLYKDTGYNYDQVRRWTLPKRLAAAGQASESILECDRIVVPVHQGVHWVCAVIDVQNQKLLYYDSLKGEDHKCLEQLAMYLRDEYRNKRNQQRDDVLDWPREFPKRIPKQLNGCDCGVFTLLFANHVGVAAPMTFSQANINDFRIRIVHELLHMRVD